MTTAEPQQDSASSISNFLNELRVISQSQIDPRMLSIAEWMNIADSKAIEVQSQLEKTKNNALRVTVIIIFCLAALAVLLRTPAPQVLCPFAVFLMILYSDQQRKGVTVFRFTALRLAAETLRIIEAVQHKPDQLAFVLSARRLGSHAVASLAAKACDASRALLISMTDNAKEPSNETKWLGWMSGQGACYIKASAREQGRALRARKVFNAAFGFVGFAGVAAAMWSLSSPSAISSDAFRLLMAVASATGSCGLAYMSHIREKKAFDQSFDYAHMTQVFKQEGANFETILVSESINEHVRWALRMAGHFTKRPLAIGL